MSSQRSDTSCLSCRSRKVKCDRVIPACKTCVKNGSPCQYIGKRKPGPRPLSRKPNGTSVKTLKFVNREAPRPGSRTPSASSTSSNSSFKDIRMQIDQLVVPKLGEGVSCKCSSGVENHVVEDDIHFDAEANTLTIYRCACGKWFKIGIPDLHDRFFKHLLRSMPIILREKYLRRYEANRSSHMYLRYAVWALAAIVYPKISFIAVLLYKKCLRAIETYEKRDPDRFGSASPSTFTYSIEYLQALCMCGSLEFLQGMARKSVVTHTKAVRVSQLMCLHLLDSKNKAHPTLLGMNRSIVGEPWEVTEEKRRVFWKIYCIDRYIHISTWLPTVVPEEGLYTKLPAYDLFFQGKIIEDSYYLENAYSMVENDDLSTMPDINSYSLHILALAVTSKALKYIQELKLRNDFDQNNIGELISRFRQFESQLLKVKSQDRMSVENGKLSAGVIVNSTCLVVLYETVCEFFPFLEEAEPAFYEDFRNGSLQTTLSFFENLRYFAGDDTHPMDSKEVIQHLLDAGALTDPSLFSSLYAFSKSLAFHVIKAGPNDDPQLVEVLKSKLEALTLVLERLCNNSGINFMPKREEQWQWMQDALASGNMSYFRHHLADSLYYTTRDD